MLDEIGQIEDILGQTDSQEDAQQGRHEAEDIAPAVPRDFRHAAQYLDDAPEDAVQDAMPMMINKIKARKCTCGPPCSSS